MSELAETISKTANTILRELTASSHWLPSTGHDADGDVDQVRISSGFNRRHI
jgi:hypothetical protein